MISRKALLILIGVTVLP